MPRPRSCRYVSQEPGARYFKPAGIPRDELAELRLALDEFEALRLADHVGLNAAEAAERMKISRHTFGRLLAKARHTVAEALVFGASLRIEGGTSIIHSKEQNMASTRIAIPSELPGGLNAPIAMHFGHCPCYTVADIEDGTVKDVKVLDNPPHQEGGCLAPVSILANDGVSAILAGGMGQRPLNGFAQAGIKVYLASGFLNVQSAIDAFAAGKIPPFGTDHTCSCHGDHHSL